MVVNTNDGSQAAPYLRTDISKGNLIALPEFSTVPETEGLAFYEALKAAGIQGVQNGDIDLCRQAGIGCTKGGRINKPEEADPLAAEINDQGFDAISWHVGWGTESPDAVLALVEAVLLASQKYGIGIYIETHRATITQDMWRTVWITEQFPEVRFNGDFSHWYTGQEMVYGNFEDKLDFLAPVFDRVRFLHGRIGDPGCMQVDIGDGKNRPHVDHFKEMWTRSFMGFLKSAEPGDYIAFNPELLPAQSHYARLIPGPEGKLIEEGDRWEQALLYNEIARECFKDAKYRLQKEKKAD